MNTFKSKLVSIKKASILWSDRAIKEHKDRTVGKLTWITSMLRVGVIVVTQHKHGRGWANDEDQPMEHFFMVQITEPHWLHIMIKWANLGGKVYKTILFTLINLCVLQLFFNILIKIIQTHCQELFRRNLFSYWVT